MNWLVFVESEDHASLSVYISKIPQVYQPTFSASS